MSFVFIPAIMIFNIYIKKCYEAYKLQKSEGWLRKEN